MITELIPWSFRGINPFLNSYGDRLLFGKVVNTAPVEINPQAPTTIHSAVPHRYLYAYLIAVKSLLQYHADYAVCVHDDGSLTDEDVQLIQKQLPGATVIRRHVADQEFASKVNDPFLSKVRSSYTSYLKLFDTTLFNKTERIIILDTDTLFLQRPQQVIDWSKQGGNAWYHKAPRGQMKNDKEREIAKYSDLQKVHIQTLIINDLAEINRILEKNYFIEQGFCSGFIGYAHDTINYTELKRLFSILHEKFGDKIFRWGAEQTTHGLVLCAAGAQALPVDDYFVFTQNNAHLADAATFLHFVGENRFHRLIYPKLAAGIIKQIS